MRGPVQIYRDWLKQLARDHVEDYYDGKSEADTVYLPWIILFGIGIGVCGFANATGNAVLLVMIPVGIICLSGMIFGWLVYWKAKRRLRKELGLKLSATDNG